VRTITSKQDIVTYLHHERALFDQLVSHVGAHRMRVGGAMGVWTFKDLIAHLTEWWRREASCALSLYRGEQPMPHPTPAEVQLINTWIYYTQRDRSLEQLLRDVDEVWQQFEATVGAMSEQDLLVVGQVAGYDREPLGAQVLSNFVDHYHYDHEADVVAWLARLEASDRTESAVV